MAHLPLRRHARLAVEDDLEEVGASFPGRQVERSGRSLRLPDLAEEVRHAEGARRDEPGRDERDPEKDSRQRLELTESTGFARDVPGVVGARRELVREDADLPGARAGRAADEELGRQETRHAEGARGREGHRLRLGLEVVREAGRDEGDVEDVVPVLVLEEGEDDLVAVPLAGDDGARLEDDLDRLLEDPAGGVECRARGARQERLEVGGRGELPLPLAVVAAAGRLQDRGVSEAPRGRRELLRRPAVDEVDVREAVVPEELLLERPVLRRPEDAERRKELVEAGELREPLRLHVLELVRHDVAGVEELLQPRHVAPGAAHGARRPAQGGGVRIGVVDVDVGPEVLERGGEHRPELAAAEDSDGRHLGPPGGGASGPPRCPRAPFPGALRDARRASPRGRGRRARGSSRRTGPRSSPPRARWRTSPSGRRRASGRWRGGCRGRRARGSGPVRRGPEGSSAPRPCRAGGRHRPPRR